MCSETSYSKGGEGLRACWWDLLDPTTRYHLLILMPLLEFLVERSGTCTGFSWEVEWRSRGGDVPEIVAIGSDLRGIDVNIFSSTLRHGGMWFRPIRGDMLRTLAREPQVM